jgi:hypothetical protein
MPLEEQEGKEFHTIRLFIRDLFSTITVNLTYHNLIVTGIARKTSVPYIVVSFAVQIFHVKK